VRKQRVRREQVREAQRRRRERLRMQHQRFLQLLVPEDLHKQLTDAASGREVSVQQLALDLIQAALNKDQIADMSTEFSRHFEATEIVADVDNNAPQIAAEQVFVKSREVEVEPEKTGDPSQLTLF